MKIALLTALIFISQSPLAFAQITTPNTGPDTEVTAEPLPDFELETIEGVRRDERGRPSTGRMIVAPAGMLLASFDSDGDYMISLAERDAGINRSFAAADKNANGILSLVELDDWRIMALGSIDMLPGHTQFDNDIDARVTPAEFRSTLESIAAALDDNEDGQLGFAELLYTAPTQARQRAQTPRRDLFANDRNQRRR